jgi:hypothetical protein
MTTPLTAAGASERRESAEVLCVGSAFCGARGGEWLGANVVHIWLEVCKPTSLNLNKSGHATLGRWYCTARVSKRLTDEMAACLRARYRTNLAWFDLAGLTRFGLNRALRNY